MIEKHILFYACCVDILQFNLYPDMIAPIKKADKTQTITESAKKHNFRTI